MSSDYQALCLNHDPAIVVEGEWRSAAEAVAAVKARTDERLRSHQTCDLLVGRYSYPLVEVCCPGGNHTGLLHTNEQWIDASWLRLLHAAYRSQDAEVLDKAQRVGACWTAVRVGRLADQLGVGRQP